VRLSRAEAALQIEIAENFFEEDLRPPGWEEDVELRAAVDWLTSYIPPDEWKTRRFAALRRFVNAAAGALMEDAAGQGRFFQKEDQIAWYLFLGGAFLDHPVVYDFMFGSRVVPILQSIGRNLALLKEVDGVEERARRLVGNERAQPNGGLFELLVAAAYRRAGARVRFLPERPGVAKVHDMDVDLDGRTWAVECKRMEIGEYTERERQRMRELWLPTAHELQRRGLNVLATVRFTEELSAVPATYLADHAAHWLTKGREALHEWRDRFAEGRICALDLRPLQDVLAEDDIALNGTRMQELLTGEYKRDAAMLQVLKIKAEGNPLYASECDQAIVLDWESVSEAATDNKARDVLRKVAEANRQLPDGRPGIVHVGFESVDGIAVEEVRYRKIIRSIASFDPEGKDLQFVYVNWFWAECHPREPQAFDETSHWQGRAPAQHRPLKDAMLVLPSQAETRAGVAWEPEETSMLAVLQRRLDQMRRKR
jgi:hypothetical protein